MADDEISGLENMFRRLNLVGTAERTALVSMCLYNNSMMTIRAGGPGTHSWPPAPPFETYEVLISNDPPRFWKKYSDNIESMYDKVPKLLICHHIIRSGGMHGLIYESQVSVRTGLMDLKITIPEGSQQAVFTALEALSGVHVLTSAYSLNH